MFFCNIHNVGSVSVPKQITITLDMPKRALRTSCRGNTLDWRGLKAKLAYKKCPHPLFWLVGGSTHEITVIIFNVTQDMFLWTRTVNSIRIIPSYRRRWECVWVREQYIIDGGFLEEEPPSHYSKHLFISMDVLINLMHYIVLSENANVSSVSLKKTLANESR